MRLRSPISVAPGREGFVLPCSFLARQGITYPFLLWLTLALPVMIFLVGWLKPLVGVPLAAGLAWALNDVRKEERRPEGMAFLPAATLGLTALLAMLITMSGLANHFYDTDKHRAMVFDLFRCTWPIYYHFDQSPRLLSYYLPYYLPPSLVSFFSSNPGVLTISVIGWTFALYFIALTGYFARARGALEWIGLFMVIACFGAWQWMNPNWETTRYDDALFLSIYVTQNSVGLITFLWVPQHVVPTMFCMMLLMRMKREEVWRHGGLLMTLAVYWSPLVALGLGVFVAFHYAQALRARKLRALFNAPSLFAAALLAPCLIYLARDPAMLPHGWNWDSMQRFGFDYAMFFLRSSLVMLATTLAFNPKQWRAPYFYLVIGVMLFVPLYRLGMCMDFIMRVPMAEYFYLLWVSGDGLMRMMREPWQTRKELRLRMAQVMLASLMLAPRAQLAHDHFFTGFRDARRYGMFHFAYQSVEQMLRSYAQLEQQYVIPPDAAKQTIIAQGDFCDTAGMEAEPMPGPPRVFIDGIPVENNSSDVARRLNRMRAKRFRDMDKN